MAATVNAQEKDKTINAMLNEFMQKHRRKIFLGFLIVIVFLAAFIVTLTVRDKIQSSAIIEVDKFNTRYEELKPFIGREDFAASSSQIEVVVLLADLTAFGKKSFGFASSRAYNMIADIYWQQKNWEEAETAWLAAAKAAGKSYLAPISFFNAASAAEQSGNNVSAINHYTSALKFADSFPGAVRAQFAVGRLEEAQGNNEAALQSYRSLVSKWPDDPVWTNLAQSRIMVLSD